MPAPFFLSDIADASRPIAARLSATRQGRCARGLACRLAATPRRSRCLRSKPPLKGGNQDNGEESSQGREKEGRQEALGLPGLNEKKGAIAAPFFFWTSVFQLCRLRLCLRMKRYRLEQLHTPNTVLAELRSCSRCLRCHTELRFLRETTRPSAGGVGSRLPASGDVTLETSPPFARLAY